MLIKSAEFITSATKPSQYPEVELPEIAFAGRSNVGKSSLINCLVNRKSLVKTSATPGKTRLINFFSINQEMLFVDLPGYGYAKVSKKEKEKWGPMVESYLSGRPALKGVLLLVDLRRTPGEDEFLMLDWLSHYNIPGQIVLTKSDKLGGNARRQRHQLIAKQLKLSPADCLLFSAKTKQGRDGVWARINSLAGFDEPGLDTPRLDTTGAQS